MEGIEDLAGLLGLEFGPFADWGTAADYGVLFFDFGGAVARDEGAEVFLESPEGD